MRPVKKYKDGLHYIDKMNSGIAYMWDPKKLRRAKLKYVGQSILKIICTGYYGLFKPNWDEVKEAVPEEYKDCKGVEIPEQLLTSNNIVDIREKTYHIVIANFYE